MPIPTHPNLLVGTSSGDDAAVWRITPSRALVVTADFITPIVDDAYLWGQIAAANAASDVYAMGGAPLLALNLVAWNNDELPNSLLVEVLKGAADKASEGGWLIAGGHSVEDPEPKYGMCVVGEVDPNRLLRNDGLRDGDVLILTKPLGLGIVTTSIKAGTAPQAIERLAVEVMLQLNDKAKDVAIAYGASGATDITGFGLLGHLHKMIGREHLDAFLEPRDIPLIEGVTHIAAQGYIPGGSKRNLSWVQDHIRVRGQDESELLILADAQTSGGLLFGIARDRAEDALSALIAKGVPAAIVGAVRTGSGTIVLGSTHLIH